VHTFTRMFLDVKSRGLCSHITLYTDMKISLSNEVHFSRRNLSTAGERILTQLVRRRRRYITNSAPTRKTTVLKWHCWKQAEHRRQQQASHEYRSSTFWVRNANILPDYTVLTANKLTGFHCGV